MSVVKSKQNPGIKKHTLPGIDLLKRVLISCPVGLPICSVWDDLVSALKENQVIIVSGETGSGKTTQLPKICLAAERGTYRKIACTQPRRIAAITVAARVAEELGPHGPRLVGYKIRFKDSTGPETRIKFVTDGMLLAEVQQDPRFREYDTIIVDEAHERSLNIDFLLGVLRRLLPSRPGLKVIITSATMDTAHFCQAFGKAPVIEIAGRGYPVEISYRPTEQDEQTDITTVEKVIFATEEIREKDPFGDILVFLPTEREILEIVKILKAGCEDKALILPIYGRLAASDQKRIFKPAPVQKIVVATNIAETSITVPGIKYVVDSGLARIARYNVRSRTKALPITPISKASADQRAGRAGRVQAGVCVRLYSEEEYEDRPEYTLPEIRRSNLAEVILRLYAMKLGPVDKFPFVDAPSPQAIKEGFTTLRELRALDAAGRLTGTGRIMARLPLDPRISRMIIEARHENALKEIVIIASAMSIQDPRERPAEKESQADQAHNSFKDPSSDLLTFIKMWNAYHKELKAGHSRNQIRKYCRENFISYNRIQEWKDIHDQIMDILQEAEEFPQITKFPLNQPINQSTNHQINRSIHCSVLSGFLGQIALKQEGSRYLAARGREVFLFPGSSLYKKGPKWIVATELIRTSRLFARTVAAIEPKWIEKLAGDLCRHSYSEPHWEKRRGEVMAWERVTLFGLPIVERRKVRYGKVDPDKSREIFIRQALIPGEFKKKYPFLVHNMELISEVQDLEDRTRRRDIMVDEETLYSFYDSGLRELEGILFKDKSPKGKKHQGLEVIFNERSLARALCISNSDVPLCLTKEDLLRSIPDADVLVQFPGNIEVSEHSLSLNYRFCPGDEADGVTVSIPSGILASLSPEPFEWLVPGLLQEKITYLLKSLPKQIRKYLVPIPRVAEKIGKELNKTEKGLLSSLQEGLFRQYGIRIERKMWSDPEDIPHHLLIRFEVLDRNGKVLDSGHDLNRLQESWKRAASIFNQNDPEWLKIKAKWEVSGLNLRNLPDLPSSVMSSSEDQENPIQAFPGLIVEDNNVCIRLFLNQEEALSETQQGARRLLANYLSKELGYLKRNCTPGGLLPEACIAFGSTQKLCQSIYAFLYRELLGTWKQIPSKSDLLNKAGELEGKVFQQAGPIIQLLKEVLEAHITAKQEIRRLQNTAINRKSRSQVLKDLEAELIRLTPPHFPENARLDQLPDLPRYLNALAVRARRAYVDPLKDMAKASRLEPFLLRLNEAKTSLDAKKETELAEEINQFETLIDEYRVSVFAPELGTAISVSPKRLSDAWERLRALL
ncbi:MAG: ATP-dependent RNA helicase HrpA [Deltaproteobacteria bacterium]|nr:ATP-dependent RNA helicase HrpA [Deltaproteobacteria bacterium]MDL1960731.1 ATP-dependent RNA helicase HrpA [Deltaproteobacteria bacterium]